jgi:hypothetical protein
MIALAELGRRALPYLIAAALVAAVLFGAYRHGVSVTDAEWQAKWSEQAAELATARAEAERIQRDEEQRRQTAIERVRDDAQREIDKAAADVVTANAAAVSLREQAKRLAERGSSACSSSGPAVAGKAASGAAVVLADVLARLDQRTGELAEAYDRARAAGDACERAYDAVRGD